MKKIAITFICLSVVCVTISHAQDTAAVDTSWKRSGTFGLNFTQVSLSNWSAGGESSVSGIARFNYIARYLKGKNSWDTNLDLAYGLTQNGKDDPIKSDDKIDFSTKYGRQLDAGHWFASVFLGFKSQFTEGFNYPNDSTVISDFLAPAYITLALGADYKPNETFSLFLSPISTRYIIVQDQELADIGSFGVDPAEYDTGNIKIKDGENTRLEVGALMKAVYKKDIMENVNLATKLELFLNYLEDPQNVDVNWEILLTMKVNKFINASLSTQLIYDDNTIINIDDDQDGIIEESGPRTQFKEVLGIGVAYVF